MAEKLLMGQKELLRGKIMEMAERGQITLKEAAGQLKARCRQAKRIRRAYREEGDAGIMRKSRGKPSSRKAAEETRERALKAYRDRYSDFGPAFATEKLAANEKTASGKETLRKWLIEAGLGERKRQSNPYRSRLRKEGVFRRARAI